MTNDKESVMITRVQIVYMGKLAEVDSDQVKKLKRKEALVQEAMELRKSASMMSAADHVEAASKITMKIIRLNRTIRPSVRFI
jgi:hypothetical protein